MATRPGRARSHNKKQLVDAINAKMSAFPGMIFNYTQPAEDAVDEAETGLKSPLAVKIFGGDLATLEENAKQGEAHHLESPRHHRHHGGAGARPAQPDGRARPRQDRPLRAERDDINTMVETAIGGTAASQVIQGERQFDLAGPHAGAISQGHGRHQEPADRHARRPTSAAQPIRRYQGEQQRVVHLSRIELALHRSPVQRAESRSGGRRGGSQARSGPPDETAHRIHLRLGRRIQGLSGSAGSDEDHRSDDRSADPADSIRAVRKSEVPADHSVQRAGDGTCGRLAGAVAAQGPTSAYRRAWVSWR